MKCLHWERQSREMYSYSDKERAKIEVAVQKQAIAKQYGISYCTLEEERYPSELRNMSGRPPVIYYKGNVETVNQRKNIAVIGSRKSSIKGMKLAYETGKAVGKAGLNLVNGLALGCDAEALRGALDAGGRCIAILPCGLDEIQPKSNRKLAEEIVENGGCLLSEYPVGAVPQKYMYVERDKLQSGISQGVLVVEAEESSGTMHTADFALRQYKRLACYWHKMLELSSGNSFLEKTGKTQILKSESDLNGFLQSILEEQSFEQLYFNFQ